MDEERLIVALEARIKDFERNMIKAEKRGTRSYTQLRRNSRSATRAMQTDMVRSTTAINQALAATSTQIGAFGRAFAAGAVAGGIAAFTASTRTAIRSLADMDAQAKQAGVSAEAFQEWAFIAAQNRISIDAMTDSLKEMQLRADEFVETGKGPAADAFRRLGFNTSRLASSLEDPTALMEELIENMRELDTAARIRVADEIFGGTGGEQMVRLIDQGAAGLAEMRQRANELGLVMRNEAVASAVELDRKFAEVQKRIATIAKTGVVNLAAAIQDALSIDVEEIFGSADRAIAMLGEENFRALSEAPGMLDDQRQAVENLQDAYRFLASDLDASLRNIENEIPGLLEMEAEAAALELASITDEMRLLVSEFNNGEIGAADFEEGLRDIEERAKDVSSELANVDEAQFGSVITAIGGITTALGRALGAARELRAELPAGDTETGINYGPQNGRGSVRPASRLAPTGSIRPRLPGVNSFPGEDPARGGGGRSSSDLDSLIQKTQEHIRMLDAEAAALAAVAMGGQKLGAAVDFARKKAELLAAAQREGRAITPELTAEIDALAQAYARSGQDADAAVDRLRDMESQSRATADTLADMFTGIIDGSLSASDALKQLASSLLSSGIEKLFDGFGGGGGFNLGSLLGFSSGGYTGDGGTHEPKGVVHGGEFVVRKSQVQKPGVRPFLTALNAGAVPGFAQGGFVDAPAMPAPRKASTRGKSSKEKVEILLRMQVPEGVTVEEVQQVSGAVSLRAIQDYDRSMPQRVRQINSDPRRNS